MAFAASYIPKVSDSIISSQLGDEAVILDHEKGEYFGVNSVASYIWEKIQEGGHSVEAIQAAVEEEFEVDTETAGTDLQAFLDQLLADGIIVA
jgi:hypothetical protein